MAILHFQIPGQPVSWARVKIARAGFAYVPPKTRKAKIEMKKAIGKMLPHGWVPAKGAVRLQLRFYLAKPKTMPKGRTAPIVRPDIDNYIKLVMDALNELVYSDDSQIVYIEAHKMYSDVPGTEIILEYAE